MYTRHAKQTGKGRQNDTRIVVYESRPPEAKGVGRRMEGRKGGGKEREREMGKCAGSVGSGEEEGSRGRG